MLPEQVPEQKLPHDPQLFGSDVRSTHAPKQFTVPCGQQTTPAGQRHSPFWQTAPERQTFPQLPQLYGSLLRL